MNLEEAKNRLLEMISESDHLPANELEIIPGTRIRIKKGNGEDFRFYARLYYQLANNKVPENEEYIKEVYYDLNDELAEKQGKHILNVADTLANESQSDFSRLDALNKSLNANESERKEYLKELNEENQNLNNNNITQRDELQRKYDQLVEDQAILKQAIIEVKNKINSEVEKAITAEMERLKQECIRLKLQDKSNKIPTTNLGYLDGATVLKTDEERYSNLYILSRIIKNVNDQESILNVENTICVNPSQLEAAKELIASIDFLQLINKTKEEKVKKKKKPNDDIIHQIAEELKRLDNTRQSNSEDEREYNLLIQILNVLNEANDKQFALQKVWDVAYANGPDREKLLTLLNESNFFQRNYNPDNSKVKENEAFIQELIAYLSELEMKAKQNQNISDLIMIGDRIVLKEDEIEYKNILGMLDILRNAKKDLNSTWLPGYVSVNAIDNYRYFMNNTRRFATEPIITIDNSEAIAETEKELADLAKKADKVEELEEYHLLIRKIAILKGVDSKKDLVEINGAKINSIDEVEYRAILGKLEQIRNTPQEIEENKERLEEIRKEMEALAPTGIPTPENEEKYNLLKRMFEIISSAKSLDVLQTVEGVQIKVLDEMEYRSLLGRLESIDYNEKLSQEWAINEEKLKTINEEKVFLEAKASMNQNEPLNGKVLASDFERYNLLARQTEIIENARNDQNRIPVEDVYIKSEDKEEYKKLLEELKKPQQRSQEPAVQNDSNPVEGKRIEPSVLGQTNDYSNSVEPESSPDLGKEPGEPKKHHFAIRKLKKPLSWLKRHWKLIVGLGIAINLVSPLLVAVAPLGVPAVFGSLGAIVAAYALYRKYANRRNETKEEEIKESKVKEVVQGLIDGINNVLNKEREYNYHQAIPSLENTVDYQKLVDTQLENEPLLNEVPMPQALPPKEPVQEEEKKLEEAPVITGEPIIIPNLENLNLEDMINGGLEESNGLRR